MMSRNRISEEKQLLKGQHFGRRRRNCGSEVGEVVLPVSPNTKKLTLQGTVDENHLNPCFTGNSAEVHGHKVQD